MDSTALNEQPELITIPAAARRVGIGVRQIRNAGILGLVPIYQIGGWNRVRWSEIQEWIEAQRTRPDDRFQKSGEETDGRSSP